MINCKIDRINKYIFLQTDVDYDYCQNCQKCISCTVFIKQNLSLGEKRNTKFLFHLMFYLFGTSLYS